jgi:hypothetical protein
MYSFGKVLEVDAKLSKFAQTGVDAMIWHFSAIFDNFRRKKWRFSQRPMFRSNFCKKTSSSLSPKRQFFPPFFWRKYLWNHNIGPWSHCFYTRREMFSNIKVSDCFCCYEKRFHRRGENFGRHSSKKFVEKIRRKFWSTFVENIRPRK